MLKASILLAIVFIAIVILVFFVLAIVRWRVQREALKKKTLEILVRRSHRIISILEVVSDRYLPVQTKLLLLDYLLTLIPSLSNNNVVEVSDLVAKLPEFSDMRDKLNAGIQESKDEKVTSKAYLSKVQQSLGVLPQMLREFSDKHAIDKATARRQVALIRYSSSLARFDLLVRSAELDLDADKKARALEKYRTALSEMEKVSIIEESADEIKWLKLRIAHIENTLFTNQLPV